LTLVNYASLVATNAARHRRVAGKDKVLLEFGLRRAQGPDGGISASKYCYLGGFDATSNVDAGRRFGIPVKGTHSHAFVSSFMGFDDIIERSLPYAEGGKICEDFVHLTQLWLSRMQVAFSFAIPLHIVHMSSLGNFKVYILLKASSNSRFLDECTE
jgi:nicotinate phosphoribosyltransferase